MSAEPEVIAAVGGVMDTVQWREWLDKQSEDMIVDKFREFEDKLVSTQAEIVRLKRCYESATGKPVCGEGSVIRMECQQMTTMRTQLDQQAELLQRAVEVIRYGIHEGATPKDFWDNYPITIAQALLSDLEAVVLAVHATGEENKSNYEHKEE